jgi:hypothetical protein
MALKRRDFLIFLGASASTIALHQMKQQNSPSSSLAQAETTSTLSQASTSKPTQQAIAFKPIRGTMPLETDVPQMNKAIEDYSSFEVVDDVVLPEGFTYDVLISWGDKVGNFHFGYNNDYISFIETKPNQGYLVINHEYISAKPWMETYQQVIGKKLPFEEVRKTLKAKGEKPEIDAFSLAKKDPIKSKIREIAKAAQADLGISVISIRRDKNGQWQRTFSQADRRIMGISGLEDGNYLKATGPAVAIFQKKNKQGYEDKLGDRIIGTCQNCAGGTTPWGTVLSAEENFQDQMTEDIYPDGSSYSPSKTPFTWEMSQGKIEEIGGQGNPLGYAGNKYGWMVEVDPANPKDYGTKHSWLGRFRHEAVAIRAEAGKPVAFYSGCDRRSGHLYKFVSKGIVKNPQNKANSKLLEDGMLYAAKFNANGTGKWIALKPETAIDPDSPSVHAGEIINLPQRPDGGMFAAKTDQDLIAFKQKFKTLGDLYQGKPKEKQGAILIDAHLAASAAGATCGARPEDTEIATDGSLYITYTSGSPDEKDGGPDLRIFGKDGKESEYGWIMHLVEDNNDPAGMTFTWKMFSTGGEPAEGGLGFANPDNLAFDGNGNLWMVTDMSTDKQNKAVPSRIDQEKGKPVSQSNLRGLFGNNSIWFMPTTGENAGNAYLFGFGPMECEMTGPFFSQDQQTLFIAVQHPGELAGIRKNLAIEERQYAMKSLDGQEFMQTRQVPIGSNWPSKQTNDPPKPSVITIHRLDRRKLV